MASLEDTIRSSVPGGNIGKPLMLALVALLASGALFKGSGAKAPAEATLPPGSGQGAGGLLAGLGGLTRLCAWPGYHQGARPTLRYV